MKNFPNQFSDPEKFRQSLEAIEALRSSNRADNDGELGAELARRDIYRLTGRGTLAQRLRAEQQKKPSNQGTRTAAREMRRTLQALELLDPALSITPMGRALLAASPGSEGERAIWRHALVELELGESGEISHPVRLLLQLVAAREIHARDGMELVLEARDDSSAELSRLLALIDKQSEERRAELGISKAQQDNARKIFPRLAQYAGLIERNSKQDPWVLTEFGRNALTDTIGAGAPTPPPRQQRRGGKRPVGFRGGKRAVKRGTVQRRRGKPRAPRRQPTPEEQALADQLLYERTDRHEALLDSVLAHVPAGGASWEDSRAYDLLVDLGSGSLLLFELKTLELDEATQVRRAIGQLIFYEGVVVAPEWPGREVERIAAFESPLPDYLAELLEQSAIAAIWCDADGLHSLNERGQSAVRRLTTKS